MRNLNRTAIAAMVVCAGAAAGFAQNVGPSTTTVPYILPTAPGVSTTSILTVGDTIGGYRMVSIPDGLGAFTADGQQNAFTLLMNHELGATVGAVRAHGTTGAFVSRWEIGNNLQVTSGRDHNQSGADQRFWDGSQYVAGPGAYGRLCSADLAPASAYRFGNLGTDARLFMNGEEVGAEGRAFAHIVTGPNTNQSYQLPYLGRFSWENSMASPFAQQKTIVAGTDDSTPGQVYFYVGDKTASGSDIERAGLSNGLLYGVAVSATAAEQRSGGASGSFSLVSVGAGPNQTGAALQTASTAAGVTEFLRPEDGAWDTRAGHENDFYFVTTDRFDSNINAGTPAGQDGRSRLYRMRFADITNPTAGGEITPLLSGTEGQQMLDNMCIDSHGRIVMQEDPGNQDHLARTWLYDIDSGGYGEVARFRADLFGPGAPGLLTRDEESSGIIDAGGLLGDGWFLLDAQAHYGIPGELVEGGQLLAMYIDPSIIPSPGAVALLGLGGLVVLRRRR